jgi:hypothetical protein
MTRRAKVCMLVAVTSMLSAVAIAADLEVVPRRKPAAPATPAAPISTNPFAAPDAACLEWTDDCRVCQKSPAGEASCSNVGTACVPKAPRCTRR